MSTDRIGTEHRELDDLFERYRLSPQGHVFAPLADACRKAGMIDEALEICSRGVAAHPRYASGWVVQGKCLFDAGKTTEAETAFRRVLDIDRNNLVALKYLGVIRAGRGELALARDHFEHILALDPDNREIRALLDEVRDAPAVSVRDLAGAGAGAPAAAAETAEELEDIDDEDFEGEPITLRDESVTPDEIATMTLADIYAAQGYVARALKIYREVYERQPGEALRAKIEALEARPAPAVPSAADDVPAAAEDTASGRAQAAATAPAGTPVPGSEAPRRPAVERGVDAAHPADIRRTPAAPRSGAPIDETRNYEQFKRWLKAMQG